MNKIVLDLETQKSFDEVGGFDHNDKLGVSIVGVYDYMHDKFMTYREEEISQLQPILEQSETIGFNIKNFDFEVLRPYLDINVNKLKYLDIMEDFEKYAGHRIKLESLAQTNLGIGKSGSGLDALKYYKERDFEKLAKYCLDDVRITRDLYNLGSEKAYLKYVSKFEDGELAVPASWGKKVTSGQAMNAFARSHITREPIEIDYISKKIAEEKSHRKKRKIQVLDFIQGGVEAKCFLRNQKRHFRPDRVVDIIR
ncbi:ribonuclease H-like domain-containing protein [Patescibacteria group bacterium]